VRGGTGLTAAVESESRHQPSLGTNPLWGPNQAFDSQTTPPPIGRVAGNDYAVRKARSQVYRALTSQTIDFELFTAKSKARTTSRTKNVKIDSIPEPLCKF
jgi:hypothetical protein